MNFDEASGCFYIKRELAGSIPIRIGEGWVGGGIPTLRPRESRLVAEGNLITKDNFLAAMFISNASAGAKAVLKRATKWSWEYTERRDIPLPDGVTPYPYQTIGATEMKRLLAQYGRCILADDMGLGKSLQIIALANMDETIDSILIVCPATIRLNWAREFAKFSTRKDLTVWQAEKWYEAGCPPKCVVITNYERLGPPETRGSTPEERAEMDAILEAKRLELKAVPKGHLLGDPRAMKVEIETRYKPLIDAHRAKVAIRIAESKKGRRKGVDFLREELKEFQWGLVACDESHNIKNSTSQRSKAIWGLLMGAQKKCKAIFATGTPITRDPLDAQFILEMIDDKRWSWPKFTATYCDDEEGFDGKFRKSKKNFKNLDVLNCRLRLSCMIRRLKDHVLPDLPPKVRTLIPLEIKSSGEQRAALTSLRQAEATQARLDWDAINKGVPLFDRDTRQAAQSRVSQTFDNLALARVDIGEKKVDDAIEYVKNVMDGGAPDQKIIVFAHHRAVVAALSEGLQEYGVVKVIGGMTPEQKQAAVDQFQTGAPRVFIGNFAAAGVGITLTRASKVVCVEFDWTPAIMDQAEDRARRIGQTCTVFVDMLYAEGTIDSILLGILNRKREQARDTLDGGKGNGEDILPSEDFTAPLSTLALTAQGEYAKEILRLFDADKQFTRNHLALLLATIVGEKR